MSAFRANARHAAAARSAVGLGAVTCLENVAVRTGFLRCRLEAENRAAHGEGCSDWVSRGCGPSGPRDAQAKGGPAFPGLSRQLLQRIAGFANLLATNREFPFALLFGEKAQVPNETANVSGILAMLGKVRPAKSEDLVGGTSVRSTPTV